MVTIGLSPAMCAVVTATKWKKAFASLKDIVGSTEDDVPAEVTSLLAEKDGAHTHTHTHITHIKRLTGDKRATVYRLALEFGSAAVNRANHPGQGQYVSTSTMATR